MENVFSGGDGKGRDPEDSAKFTASAQAASLVQLTFLQ